MQTYEKLRIPKKDSSRPIKSGAIRTIVDIQINKFCNRAGEFECCSISCESCLFSWYHTSIFKKWYRENKLKYRNLGVIASFE